MSDTGAKRFRGWTFRLGRHRFELWWLCYGYSNGMRGWTKPFPWTNYFLRKP